MIFVFSSWLIYYLILVLSVCDGQRRIIGGHNVTANHRYMVYLIKATISPSTHLGWLCGGTLVKKRLAVTSAACVRDVPHLYLIAGYNRYVTDSERHKDKCINNMKKRVIAITAPTGFTNDYTRLWTTYLDLAVVKTDSDVTGVEGYREHCHYIPKSIKINYNNANLQKNGTHALILGWGHTKDWREYTDPEDTNQIMLQYGSTMVFDKPRCRWAYKDLEMEEMITKSLICTYPPMSFNDKSKNLPSDTEESVEFDTNELKEGCSHEYEEDGPFEAFEEDKVGICQNDHGGPLLYWQSKEPRLIGVASAFKHIQNKCYGPFLYTSTYCNAKFLRCVINRLLKEDKGKNTRGSTQSTASIKVSNDDDIRIIERRVSWLNHPDGPSETEKCQLQPQRSQDDRRR